MGDKSMSWLQGLLWVFGFFYYRREDLFYARSTMLQLLVYNGDSLMLGKFISDKL